MYVKNSHEIGQKGEMTIQKLINDISYFSDKIERRGGTKSKTDFYFNVGETQINISGKSKSTLKSGSFDWGNISSCNSIFGDHFDELENKLNDIRLTKTLEERKKLKKSLTQEFNLLCDQCFDRISKEDALLILQQVIVCDIHHVIVDDRSSNTLYDFHPQQHPLIKILNEIESVSFVKKVKTASSRTIIFTTKDNVQHDYGIRLRVMYNNGMSAKLKLNENSVSKKNNNATLCIKIQQEKLYPLLTQDIDCKITRYNYDKQTDKYFNITQTS